MRNITMRDERRATPSVHNPTGDTIMSLTKIENTNANTETNGKKARKPRETKLTIENAGKACSIKPEVTQDVVAHALVFFAAHFNPSGRDDQIKKARALKIAESFRVMREVKGMQIGEGDEAEQDAKTQELIRAFGVSTAVKPVHAQ